MQWTYNNTRDTGGSWHFCNSDNTATV